jgi:uncharacterized protein
MFGKLRWFSRQLAGRAAEELTAPLRSQLRATAEAVEVARALVDRRIGGSEAVGRISEVEQRGKACRQELVAALSSALAPPMDREDLFRFSRSVEDVLDNLEDLVHELHLFALDDEPLLDGLLQGVADGVELLTGAVAVIPDDPSACRRRAADATNNDIRRGYEAALATLLTDDAPVTNRTLRRREVLRRVDVIGLRLEEAADALSDGAVKRSY